MTLNSHFFWSPLLADQRADKETELAATQYFADAFSRSVTEVLDRKADADKLVTAAEVSSATELEDGC